MDLGNPYVRIEAATLPNAGGGPARTALRRIQIDVNGNTKQVEEFDWVNHAAVPRGGAGNILDVGPAAVARKMVSTYHNNASPAGNSLIAFDLATAYFHPSSVRNLRTVSRTETQNAAGDVAAAAEFVFDDHTTTANLLQERRWNSEKAGVSAPLTAANSAVTSITYSTVCPARPDEATDPNGYKVKTTYTANCAFPYQEERAYGRTEKRTTRFSFDSSFSGLLTGTTDADNTITTTRSYDKLGRPELTIEAAGSTVERKTAISYDSTNRRVTTRLDKSSSGDGAIITVEHFDARSVNWLSQERENGTVPSSATDFSNSILRERRVRPATGFTYSSESNPYRTTSDTTMGWTLTLHDTGGRRTSTTHYSGSASGMPGDGNGSPQGTTGFAYDGEFTTITAPDSKPIRHMRDALGRIVKAEAGGTTAPTVPQEQSNWLSTVVSTYDPLDNLKTVTQGSQLRTFTYSSLSRLLLATQPENGTTTYTYDDAGNLLSRQDARGATTGKSVFLAPAGSAPGEKAYDGLGRPRRKQVKDFDPQDVSITKEVIWTWDTATKGKGQLQSVSYDGTTIGYSAYDELGRVTAHSQTTNGVNYPFAYTYFRNDEVNTITYPSGKVMTYTLDAAGRPFSAVKSAPSKTYVTSATYTGHGSLAQMTFGEDKLKLTNTLNRRLQTTQIKTERISPAAELQRLEYDYHKTAETENNGNARVHRIYGAGESTRTQRFEFDMANRLQSMKEDSVGGALALDLAYGFDAFNNMWTTSGNNTISSPAYTPQAAGAFDTATNRFNTAVINDTYDAAGHPTKSEQGAIDNWWDSEGRRVKSKNGSFNPTYFRYDGAGQRVKKSNVDWGEYVYVFDAFGRIAAEYGPGINGECSTCYPVGDITGSTRLVANQNGDAVQRFDFSGFGTGITTGWSWTNGRSGAQWDDVSAVKQQWGGHYRDDMPWEGATEFFGARAYKRPYGRFLSPDENLVDQDPGDPLSWNLFAYARNNPIANGDPDGRGCVYLNGRGNEVDRIENEIDAEQCGKTHGYWVDGVVTQARFAHGSLILTGTTDGSNRTSASYGLGPNPRLQALAEAGRLAEGPVNLAGAALVTPAFIYLQYRTGLPFTALLNPIPPVQQGRPFPVGTPPGTVVNGVDPTTLRAGEQQTLHPQRLDTQRKIPGTPTIDVTPDGVIADGHHRARVAAERGLPVNVRVVAETIAPRGPVLQLPIKKLR